MRIRLFLLLLLLPCLFYAQEIPPIQNFSSADYGADNQNWAIDQSSTGHIYAANNAGLLEFNGAHWKLYPSPNGTIIRSVQIIDDVIYTGCYMEFGYWKRDDTGQLVYSSLSNELDVELIEDEQIWNILDFENWILFQSLDRIYFYDKEEESFDVIDQNGTRAGLFMLNGDIVYQSPGRGLYKIEKGGSTLVSDSETFLDNTVIQIFQNESENLILTESGEFWRLTGSDVLKRETEAEEVLRGNNVYSSLKLKDGTYVLGTISDGMFHLDSDGSILRTVNQSRGLANNTVLSIFEDKDSNIWLAMDNGISNINLHSPFREYNDPIGRLGVIYASIIHEGNTYLGTNQGLFYRPLQAEGDFRLIPETQGQVWSLRVIDDRLFCGHNSGTFEIKNQSARLISAFPGTWEMKQVPGKANLILQGNYSGLSILEKSNGEWKFKNALSGFDISSRFFEFATTNQVIVNHEQKGLYLLELDPELKNVKIEHNWGPRGTGSSIVRYRDDILYAHPNNVYKYNPGSLEFDYDAALSGFFYSEENPVIGILTSDSESDRLWGFGNENIIYVSPDKIAGRLKSTQIPIPSFFRRSMGVYGFESISPVENDSYLIGRSNGYAMLDLSEIRANRDYTIEINAITKEKYNQSYEALLLNEDSELKYEDNSLNFSYSVSNFDKYQQIKYRYKLEGLYEEWSDWSDQTSASFSNLPYGDYIFKVQSRIGNDLSVNTAQYSFTIQRPWYWSNSSIISYIIILLVTVSLIHILYRSYYRRKQRKVETENRKKLKRKKLKGQQKITQLRNEQLRSEIESKNRELAASTMSIIKKNEFLNHLKTLLQDKAGDPNIKQVLRTIDQNINTEDDWKFFEEAFNNADKDFLQKIKSKHPELTPNDLRLCAYLRLNLSSKEIAPLLNISVRSVEVKRYRLRKKMELAHENSLTEYILSL